MSLRVGIVNDMRLATEVLRLAVTADPGLAVAWIAANGNEAVARCAENLPDVVLMDLVMPVLNGVEATRRIMRETPCPILIVTSTIDGHLDMVYEAMGCGALDVVTTPVVGDSRASDDGSMLRRKIHALCSTGPAGRRATPAATPANGSAQQRTGAGLPPLLAVGASTGGPAALAAILAALPADFPAAVVIAQHIDAAFVGGLADWLGTRSKLPVALARAGDRLRIGHVLVADSSAHLVLRHGGLLDYSTEPRESFHHPSIDTFFDSAARNAPPGSLAMLLTGMGRDGAEGLLAMRRAGFRTIAQDAASSVVYGMPRAAAELDAAMTVAPLETIPALLQQAFTRGAST